MRILLRIATTALLMPAAAAFAADVEYQHPNITIVASDEPLDSVLKSVSREMQIFVTTPAGFNPIVNCDIQHQPVEQAFKKLMSGMSYSLEWKSDGRQLIGLTILSGSEGPEAAVGGGNSAVVTRVNQSSVLPGATYSGSGAEQQNESGPISQTHDGAIGAESPDRNDNPDAESESLEIVAGELGEQEVVARELGEREIELELQRQEEVIAHEAKMEEEKVRNQAEMAEYFETFGISPNP